MEVSAYAAEAAVEVSHWWFVARRALFSSIIRSRGIPREAPTLDIGTSTGSNLRLLRDLNYSNVIGVDTSDVAIRFCAEKGLGRVRQADVCQLPFPSNMFHLVFVTDVLEHVEDDRRALSEVARVLAPGGAAIITVPAFQCLWGRQDDVACHKRRYRLRRLEALIRSVKLSCAECF